MKRFIALAACILVLSGCAGNAPEKAEGYTFTDALGREVCVKSYERVAALLGSFADVWMLAGGEVAAASDDAWDDFALPLPEDCINLGGAHSPGLEALLSANPDFVIASASTAADVAMKDTLESAGITVAYFDVDCFEDYLEMLDICTDITGRKDLFEENGLNVKQQIDDIKAQCEKADIPEEKRTVLLLRASAGAVKAKGSRGTVLGEMLLDLNCINIADGDESLLENLSVEAVMQNEPYRIFVVTMGNDTARAIENITEMIRQNPAWGSLAAVRGNRLHFMDRRLFNLKPNAKWADAYEELGEILLEE